MHTAKRQALEVCAQFTKVILKILKANCIKLLPQNLDCIDHQLVSLDSTSWFHESCLPSCWSRQDLASPWPPLSWSPHRHRCMLQGQPPPPPPDRWMHLFSIKEWHQEEEMLSKKWEIEISTNFYYSIVRCCRWYFVLCKEDYHTRSIVERSVGT